MALDKNPIATKAVTSAVLTLAGDLICQVYLQRFACLYALQQAFGFSLCAM
jgi:peroxisomal membrane protein 2